jgi:hypothetical protein
MRSRAARIALLAVLSLALTGCYRHVVGAKGFGAQGRQIHKANAPDPSPSGARTPLKRDSTYIPDR